MKKYVPVMLAFLPLLSAVLMAAGVVNDPDFAKLVEENIAEIIVAFAVASEATPSIKESVAKVREEA